MHGLAQILSAIFGPLTQAASALAAEFSQLACTPLGSFGLAAAVVTSLVLGSICGAWAIAERTRAIRDRRRLIGTARRLLAGLRFRDALLEFQSEATVVLKRDAGKSLSFAGGKRLLQHCLAGPDAKLLATRIESLLRQGSSFQLAVRTIGIRDVTVRGCVIRRRPVISLLRRSDVAGTTGERRCVEAAPADESSGFAERRPDLPPMSAHDPDLCAPETDNALEEALNMKPGAQDDGILTVAPDGRIRDFNQTFAERWSLKADRLRNGPRLDEVARWCEANSGRSLVWNIVAAAIGSPEPDRYGHWSVPFGAEGRRASLSFSRLRDGGTRVAFAEQGANRRRAA